MLVKLDKFFIKYTYLIYLCTLLFWIGFLPLLEITGLVPILELLVIIIVSISAFYFFIRDNKLFRAYVICSATLIFSFLNFFTESHLISQIDRSIVFILFGFITAHFISKITSEKKVTLELIIISIAAYIMIGIMSAIACWFTYNLYPGAYNISIDTFGPVYEFMYYSIVTMSTLGYGDIAPQIAQSKSLAIIITLIGQFYMAILVAFLIGKFLSQKN